MADIAVLVFFVQQIVARYKPENKRVKHQLFTSSFLVIDLQVESSSALLASKALCCSRLASTMSSKTLSKITAEKRAG